MNNKNKVKTINKFLKYCKRVTNILSIALSRGVLGEILVYRKLLENGMEPQYFGGTKKGFNIKIKKSSKEITIDCKEKSKPKWVRLHLSDYWKMEVLYKNVQKKPTKKQPNQPDFYIFVDSQKYLNADKADFYVFRKNKFCEFARGHYFKNKSTRKRPKNPKSTDFTLEVSDVKKFRDNDLSKIKKAFR